MIKKLFLFVFGLVALNTQAQVVPNIDWVKYYAENNTMDNIPSTLDAVNNVYVTGYTHNGSNRDISVLKYDSLGTLLWTQFYGSVSGDDEGTSIKVDPAGNVYVAGYTYVSGQLDLFTAKYSSTGTQLWANTYDVTGADDKAVDIEFDASGKVYVLATTNNGSDKDITVIRYTSGGSIDYIYDYNPYSLDDNAVGMVLMSTGELMVTGNCYNGSFIEIHVFQLDGSGNLINSNKFNGTGSGDNKVTDIVSAANNIVICGSFNNGGTNDDYVTLKIDNTINAIWQADYDVANGYEYATSLVKDSIGNIAVTGYVSNGGIYEYHTLLYDSTGIQLWTNIENTGIAGLYIEPRIARDTIAHHFYVSGAKANTTNDIFVYQIAPSGNTKWREEFNGPASGHDAGTGIVVNGVGVVYLSALTTNTNSGFDITTIKISQTPVYYPIDFNNVNEPNALNHYFYPNGGEILKADTVSPGIANEVKYYTKNTYPQQFILNNNNLAFLLAKPDTAKTSTNDSLHRVDLNFVHSNPLTRAYHFDTKNDNVLNYFLGQVGSPKTNVKGSTRIMIPNIYPGIDLHYYSNNSGLKIYFVVKPGTQPDAVLMNFTGATSTSLTSGEVIIKTKLGNFKFASPQVYSVDQSLNTTTVTSSWNSLGSNYFALNTGTYSPVEALVIQINQGNTSAPSSAIGNINWSTYLGSTSWDMINRVNTDANNNLFAVGRTYSPNFPQGVGVTNIYQPGIAVSSDAFISKFKPSNELEWSTYVGGNRSDEFSDISFHSNGNLYCVGNTTSSNLITKIKTSATNYTTFVGPFVIGEGWETDGFIFELGQNGVTNPWLTYYPGDHYDYLNSSEFDGNGNFFVVGNSSSTDLPILGPSGSYTAGFAGNISGQDKLTDGIIVRFENTNNAITWATYVGSSSVTTGPNQTAHDVFHDIAIAGSTGNKSSSQTNGLVAGDLYVVGRSGGYNYPVMTTSASSNYSYNFSSDAVLTRFNNTGTMLWSTYLGSAGEDIGRGIKINNDKVYLTGISVGSGFPNVNSGLYYHQNYSAGWDAFLTVVDENNAIEHSTYIGGTANEYGFEIAFDSKNIGYLTGHAEGGGITLIQPVNTYTQSYAGGFGDNFIVAFKRNSTALQWSTYLGGTQDEVYDNEYDRHISICIDGNDNLYHGGLSWSNQTQNFPLNNAGGPPAYFQGTLNGNIDATITKFNLVPVQPIGIKENSFTLQNSLFAYPNPASNHLTVKLDNNKKSTYKITNMLGQIVSESILNPDLIIPVNNLNKGIYILEITNDNTTYSTKFIKVD